MASPNCHAGAAIDQRALRGQYQDANIHKELDIGRASTATPGDTGGSSLEAFILTVLIWIPTEMSQYWNSYNHTLAENAHAT